MTSKGFTTAGEVRNREKKRSSSATKEKIKENGRENKRIPRRRNK